ncbi:MAG TPA: M15 family metallopeptidase [Steroidobacteraceae bacterium]|nr:M15 family metallopeptidase [Steroidobacteraceae bacterium]
MRAYAIVLMLLFSGCVTPQTQVTVSNAKNFADVGIVDIGRIIPDVALDIRYAGANNFVGIPVDGYEAPKCFLLADAAAALARAEASLRKEGLRLKIFDCYRPVRAVKHFVRWAEELSDQRTKAQFYPNLDKTQLLGEYIAPVSGHSRAATLDVTLMSCERSSCEELDMGTPFDFFDLRAQTDSGDVTSQQQKNRDRLREALHAEGFENYSAEWWHYTFRPEPSPNVAYDIPVQ